MKKATPIVSMVLCAVWAVAPVMTTGATGGPDTALPKQTAVTFKAFERLNDAQPAEMTDAELGAIEGGQLEGGIAISVAVSATIAGASVQLGLSMGEPVRK